MGNNTLIRGTIITLILIALFTIVMLTLIGKDGLINREKEDYNNTHVEEINERNQEKDNGKKIEIVEEK